MYVALWCIIMLVYSLFLSLSLFYTHTDTATSSGQVLWKPVESTGQRISSIAGTSLGAGVESMQQEVTGSDDSPSTTPSTSPRSMGGSSPVVSTAAGIRVRM